MADLGVIPPGLACWLTADDGIRAAHSLLRPLAAVAGTAVTVCSWTATARGCTATLKAEGRRFGAAPDHQLSEAPTCADSSEVALKTAAVTVLFDASVPLADRSLSHVDRTDLETVGARAVLCAEAGRP